MPTAIQRGDRENLDADAADFVVKAIHDHLKVHATVVLGVVGGRSVGGIYRHLQARDLPWNRVHVFLADERLVPVSSDESNFRLVRSDLLALPLEDGRLPEANAHPYPFDPDNPATAVSSYSDALETLGGRFDIAILSAGEDGHTASLFPNHPSVRAAAPGFILVENSPKPPPSRISASRNLLQRTRIGVLVFYGEGKRSALAKFLDPSLRLEDCPSKVIDSMQHGIVLTDLKPQ